MSHCGRWVEVLAWFFALPCGFSWLYWVRAIVKDVNTTLPVEQQMPLDRTWSRPLSPRVHRAWSEHARLFPRSRKRIYAAISLLSFFLGFVIPFAVCELLAASSG